MDSNEGQHTIRWDAEGNPMWCMPADLDPREMVRLAPHVGQLFNQIQTLGVEAA